MLPDFPKTKTQINDHLLRRARKEHETAIPFLRGVRRIFLHEGNRHFFERSDGSVGEFHPQEFSAKLEIKRNELAGLTLDKAVEKVVSVARSLAGETERHALKVIDEAASLARGDYVVSDTRGSLRKCPQNPGKTRSSLLRSYGRGLSPRCRLTMLRRTRMWSNRCAWSGL